MSAFITQCPHCETTFNTTQAQMKIAQGVVRCGFCLRTFSALDHMVFLDAEAAQLASEEEALPEISETDVVDQNIEPDDALAAEFAESQEYEIPRLETGSDDYPESVPEQPDQPTALPPRRNAEAKAELQTLSSLYDEETRLDIDASQVEAISDEAIIISHHSQRTALLTATLVTANVLLILGLTLQYAWANIENFLLDSRFAAISSLLCSYASCPEVERFDLSQFLTDDLIVNSHDSIANALQIDFIFRNTADYEQAFPLVELNFSDLNRRLVANRLFTPQEYLDEGLQQFTHMPANSSLQVHLEIADPGPQAINYTLLLRSP